MKHFVVCTLIVIFSVILSGCNLQGKAIEPSMKYKGCPFKSDDISEVTVTASQRWQDTGVIVDIGDEIFLEASGEWNLYTAVSGSQSYNYDQQYRKSYDSIYTSAPVKKLARLEHF